MSDYKGNIFNIIEKDELVYLQVPSFEKTNLIKHGISTRMGGVSKGFYKSMNLGLYSDDAFENVRENYNRFCKVLNIKTDSLVHIYQTHKDQIKVVDRRHMRDDLVIPEAMWDYDGLMTDVAGVTLVTSYADCVPVLMMDPVKKVIAMSHAGWRGTIKKIGKKTVEKMIKTYGSKAENILVCIGPSIGPDHFEVGEEVYEAFDKGFNHDIMGKIVYEMDNKDDQERRFKIDLWQANALPLLEIGIRQEHLTVNNLCTMCRQDLFFSHRGSKGIRGSMVAMMTIKE